MQLIVGHIRNACRSDKRTVTFEIITVLEGIQQNLCDKQFRQYLSCIFIITDTVECLNPQNADFVIFSQYDPNHPHLHYFSYFPLP